MLRRLLPVLLLAALIAPAVHAQTSNIQCPYAYLCVNTNPATNDPYGYTVLLGGTSSGNGNNTAIGVNSSVATDSTMAGGTAIGYLSRIGAGSTGFAGGAWSQINSGMNGVSLGTQSLVTYYAGPNGPMPTGGAINSLWAGGVAVGPSAVSGGVGTVGIGSGVQADGNYDVTIGGGALSGGNTSGGVNGGGNVVIGYNAQAPYLAQNNVVLGYMASVGNSTTNSVVLGANTTTNENSVVAVGNRRVTQVANGVNPNDAVNLSQLTAATSGGTGSTNDPNAVHYDLGTNSGSVTLQGATGTQIHNVAPGTSGMDAVNLNQLNSAIASLPPSTGGAPVWISSTDTTTPAKAQGQEGTSLGAGSQAGNANTAFNTVIGANAQGGTTGSAMNGTGGQNTVVGAEAKANGIGAGAWGYSTTALCAFCDAYGSGSTANQDLTASFGSSTFQRRLVNVANGINATDAMTMGQGQTITSIFGGGANLYTNTAPTYTFTSPGAAGSYYDVGSALSALDNGLNAVNTRINNLPPPGTGGGTGTDPTAVHYDNGTDKSVTLQGQGGTQVHNVAAGTASTDAANVGQVQAAQQAAVSTSEAYTDASSKKTLASANSYTDSKTALSVQYDNASKTNVTLGGANANGTPVTPAVTLSNVAAGEISATSTQAVNGAQVYQVQQSAQAYTDQAVSGVKDWAKSYTDNKFAQARQESAEAGAAGGAIGTMALSATRVTPEYRSLGNLSMATGVYDGRGAIAMGWSQTFNNGRVGVAVAASWTGNHTFVGGSVSIGLGD